MLWARLVFRWLFAASLVTYDLLGTPRSAILGQSDIQFLRT